MFIRLSIAKHLLAMIVFIKRGQEQGLLRINGVKSHPPPQPPFTTLAVEYIGGSFVIIILMK